MDDGGFKLKSPPLANWPLTDQPPAFTLPFWAAALEYSARPLPQVHWTQVHWTQVMVKQAVVQLATLVVRSAAGV